MKAAVADYRYRVYCLRIVPIWGAAVYLTSHVRDLSMGGHTYLTQSGYEFSGAAHEDSMAPGVLDLTGIAGLAGIGFDQIVSGVFDGARVYAFATTWRTPVEDEEPIGVAVLGKTQLRDHRYIIEMMSLIDALNQTVGKTYTVNCQKEFGGQEFAGCKIALGPITVTGTLTHVESNRIFRDTARTEARDWFGEGAIAFTTGQNAGLKPLKIKRYVGPVDSKSITGITKATQAVVTIGAHTFIVGDEVTFSGVVGMTQINGLSALVTAVAATTITVAINSTGFSTYTSGGTVAMKHGLIETHEAFHYPVAAGDAYTMIPGCRHRLEDCRDKWNNVEHDGGFRYVPVQSATTKTGA